VLKNYCYHNQPSFTTKIKEFFVAPKLENQYTKNHILTFYINNIYYPHNQYTLQPPPNHYFPLTLHKNNSNIT
ncbi:transglycosylase domain-containing protein, partial [Staphylococcus epidermidis]|uniref:transglycosylase domain-containing protein n=1 Tax=Staphylococcus epidermidis TaxID=1282 RepID=UPI0016436560